jgi:predicted LPLAT superfamily acyltransferase
MSKTEWSGKTSGGKVGQGGLLWFFGIFDVRLGYFFMAFVVPFYFIFAFSRAYSIYDYFRRRHGYGRLKAWYKTFVNHYRFGQVVLDRFAIFCGQKNKFKLTVDGQEIWDEICSSPRGCIVASSHTGNYEIAGYLMGRPSKTMNGIVYGHEAEKFAQCRSQLLAEHNMALIAVGDDDLSPIFLINNALDNGEIVSVLCDRVYSGNKKKLFDFMGESAYFPTGAFNLAVRKNCDALAFFVMREKGMHYHIYIRRLSAIGSSREEKIDSLTDSYVRAVEDVVRRYPEQWYNFYPFWNK